MNMPSDDNHKGMYEKIIGLGEKSIRKSYYPLLRKKIQELEREIEHRLRKEEELKRQYENQSIVNSLLKSTLDPIPLEQVCDMALDKILSLSWLKDRARASLFLVEDKPGVLVLNRSKSASPLPEPMCGHVAFGQCLCGKAAQEGRTFFDIHRGEAITPHSHYCVPIRLDNTTIGAISITLSEKHMYNKGEEETLEAISNTLAGIIQRHTMAEEKIKLENQLRQTQKMEAIGALSGGIAHDFNNLLTPILGYTEMMLYEMTPDDPLAKDLGEVVKAANLAKDLVRQILTLSRQSDHELKPIKIDWVVKDAYKLLRPSIPTTIDIVTQMEDHAHTVLADATQIHQVLMNLCTNAYHAMKDTGGTLVVSTRIIQLEPEDERVDTLLLSPGTYQMLSVSDTGIGMNKITMERIFDPYFTTKSKHEGTGLGLSVVHGIIKSFGGHITVYSELGKGTTFRVYLPCTDQINLVDKEAAAPPIPIGTEHIMVVDDEETIIQMMSSILKSKGYHVTECLGSREALRLFENYPQHYDLIITDMTMPKMTGTQLAKTCRDIRPDIPLILCTGFSELIDEQKARAFGFQKFLMKPIIMRDLCQAVRDALDEREQKKEASA